MNMEHFTGVFIWIFTFISCFQATPVNLGDCKLKYLESDVTCPQDSRFYTPTVEVECLPAALDCIRKELNGTAAVECEDTHDYIGDAVECLDEIIKEYPKGNHKPPKSSECECERWQMTPFSVFLQNMKSLLHLENSVHYT